MSESPCRIVITGMGAVTPMGSDAQSTWKQVIEGQSGVGEISLFNTEDCPVKFAAEVKDFNPCSEINPVHIIGKDQPITQATSPKEARKMGRFIQLGLKASIEAYLDSGLESLRSKIDPRRIGVSIGVGMGGLGEIEVVHSALLDKGYRRITPFFIPQVIPNLAAGQVSILLNFQGPNLCNATACSSSAHSIGEAAALIERGDADIMFAGGAESTVCPLGIGGFAALRALSTRNDAPQKASRPFDVNRDGFVMGEGSGMLVLEKESHAIKRGAKIYGYLAGYGLSADAYHVTLPMKEGNGGKRAMKMALNQAKKNPEQIDYINTHGTSTPAGDIEEAFAVEQLFGVNKKNLHVSSTKSMTGHLLGAAGAVEAILTIYALNNNQVPPTINLDQLDPECEKLGLNFTAHQAVDQNIDLALTNSFGFGGTNASLIFGKV
mgnify:CR=1 FL=1